MSLKARISKLAANFAPFSGVIGQPLQFREKLSISGPPSAQQIMGEHLVWACAPLVSDPVEEILTDDMVYVEGVPAQIPAAPIERHDDVLSPVLADGPAQFRLLILV